MSLIEVAKIVKAQGIKGEVKAQVSTNLVGAFKGIKEAYVGGKCLQVEKISLRQGFLFIKFENVDSRNDAEMLRGETISIDKSILENLLQEDEFLVDDLIGMILYDNEGNVVGQIVDVENFGATYNFVIENNGRRCEAPFLKDVFVKQGNKLIVNKEKFDEVNVW